MFLLAPKLLHPSIAISFLEDNANFHLFWDYYISHTENAGLLNLSYDSFTPINGPLWFLRDLIIMVLVAPLVFWCIMKLKFVFILLLAILFCGNMWYPILGLSIGAVFFFSLGAYFSLNGITFILSNRNKKCLLYVTTMVFLIITAYYDGMNTTLGGYIYPLYILLFVFAFLNIAELFVRYSFLSDFNKRMKKHCFFVYAGHLGLSLVYIVSTIMGIYISDNSGDFLLILRYITTFIIVTCICVLLSVITSKIMPRLYSILTGNRS